MSNTTTAPSRQARIERTSILGIVVNLLIATMKIVVGLLASSLAIVSEGINNASDAATSLLTLIGARLSAKHPDEKHPFGYGRVEYLTSLVIAALICYTGISVLRESIDGIIHPSEMSVSVLAIVLVAVSAVAKFFLGTYTIGVGNSVDAPSLVAVGEDSRNDSFFSIVTIVVSIIYLKTGFSLDAFVGVIFSIVILRAGWEILSDTIRELLGRPGEKELADMLYKEIRATSGISFAADMMLHNYGPDAWSGSVNVEIDHNYTVGEAYDFLHELQLRIMHEHHVTMVFGIYAVDNDSEKSKALRKYIGAFVKAEEFVKSFHAVYIDEKTSRIYCDFIVDYKLRDWDDVKEKFLSYMEKEYPQYTVELLIETEFV